MQDRTSDCRFANIHLSFSQRGSAKFMNLDQTQAFGDSASQREGFYRCPCGTDVKICPQKGGSCTSCQREFPASVMQIPMTMTFSDLRSGNLKPRLAPLEGEDALIGGTLGHFEIIEPIGRGGMGQVYRALDKSLQRYVAVKVIHCESDSGIDTQAQARLMHEAVAQARVNHPNIVTIFYVGQESDTTFLAMELIDGFDASELIKQGNIPYHSLCSMAIKIADALNVASQTGIVHSDIKPQNLLILQDGNVKLSDFGMARIGEDDQDELLGGTPNYLAPELLEQGKPSIQSDMYALGVTLFELTFGRLPLTLSGSSLQQWSKIHDTTTVDFPEPWPNYLPEDWKVILQRLLAKSPDDRYSSYQQLGKELNSILPVKRSIAGIVPRAIAWVIDVLTVIILSILPLAVVSVITVGPPPAMNGFNLLAALIVYLMAVYWWRQSLGRYLFHLKVVNRYSLKPSRKNMLLREMARMQIVWTTFAGALSLAMAPRVGLVLMIIGALLFAIDFLYTITLGLGKSIHDKLLGTQSVIVS